MSIRFHLVFKKANFTADVVANLDHGLSSQVVWELGLPLSDVYPFYLDLFGLSCPKGFTFLFCIKKNNKFEQPVCEIHFLMKNSMRRRQYRNG